MPGGIMWETSAVFSSTDGRIGRISNKFTMIPFVMMMVIGSAHLLQTGRHTSPSSSHFKSKTIGELSCCDICETSLSWSANITKMFNTKEDNCFDHLSLFWWAVVYGYFDLLNNSCFIVSLVKTLSLINMVWFFPLCVRYIYLPFLFVLMWLSLFR